MLRSFLKKCDGSVATLGGMMITVTTLAIGGSMDYAKAVNQRQALQEALDTSVLIAVSDINAKTESERKTVARKTFLDSYFCEQSECPTPSAAVGEEGEVSLEAALDVPTALLRVFGWDSIEVKARSEAISMGGPLEVVMVLDYSWSMNSNSKYQNMRTAALEFLNQASTRPGGKIDVGIVPFSRYVMTPLNGTYLNDVVEGDNLDGIDVVGCLMNRDYPYSVSSASPTNDARWPVVSYAPGSEPSAGGYSATSAYEKAEASHNCNHYAAKSLWARPLSKDFSGMSSAITAMRPVENTNIALGLDVGWHILTPEAPFAESQANTDDELQQVAILLTDGMQTVPADGPHGYTTDSADANIASICTSMKASGIKMFTIAFDVDDADTKTLLRNCATGEPYYYEVDSGAMLQSVFQGIYNTIAPGKPRLTG